jgi:ribokinase
MRSEIVVVGSLNADLVTRIARFPSPGETVLALDFAVHPGGKGANQAYAAARLGARVSMLGCVGRDPHGDLLTENLRKAGVDVSPVTVGDEAPTGMALIAVDASGENQIVVVSGANARLTPGRLRASEARVAGAAVVLLQLEVPLSTVETAARIAHEGGATVILDPAPARPLPSSLLECVDFLTPNQGELAALTGLATGEEPEAAARRLAGVGDLRVIVKMGEAGALLVGRSSRTSWPAIPVEAVDATGAGDAFNAAFAVALAEGRPPAEAGRMAVAAGALCVTRVGAQASMPTRREVDRLVAQSSGV